MSTKPREQPDGSSCIPTYMLKRSAFHQVPVPALPEGVCAAVEHEPARADPPGGEAVQVRPLREALLRQGRLQGARPDGPRGTQICEWWQLWIMVKT